MALKLIQGKQITVNLTGSFTGSFSGSFNGTSSYATNALSASYANVTASLGYTPQYRLFTDSTFVGDPTTTSELITRTGNISLKGANVYYGTQPGTDSNYGTIFGHVTSTHSTGFIAMFATQSGHSTGNNNMIIGNVPSASITNPQSTFIAIKDVAYNPWTDSRLLFRFQNGYQSGRVSLFEIGTDYIRLPIHTSSRNDSGSAISNFLFTDTTGILRSRPISAIATFPYTGSAIISGSLEITGSLNVNGGITGSLFGTSSYAISSSNALTASYLIGGVSIDTGSLVTTASFNLYTGSSTSQFAGTSSFATTAATASFVTASNVYGPFGSNSILSSSFTVSSSRAVTASFAQTAPYSGLQGTVPTWNQSTTGNAATATTASFALTSSNISPAVTNNSNNLLLTATGTGTINGESNLRFDGTTLTATSGFAQGEAVTASGGASHAQGIGTVASGDFSHAEGESTQATGYFSHAEGLGTVTSGSYQHAQGQYNISSSAQSAFIIGNGTAIGSRSNLVFASGSTFQVTGSLQVSGSITGSLFGTSSYALTASFALNAGGGGTSLGLVQAFSLGLQNIF